MKDKMNSFSVALGLFDYINPIFYAITSITILRNVHGSMNAIMFVILTIGCIISMIFGLTIPTVKFIVGLGKMKFKMPVNLVFYVNTGIFISGFVLAAYVFNPDSMIFLLEIILTVALLTAIYYKTKKFNTVAVLTGFFGYGLIYASLITLALKSGYIVSIILYAIAICLFIFLVFIGCCSDLKKPKVHWTIEISNVLCQGLVALSTVLLFKH